MDIYSDEGITGTNLKRREGFNRMIEDALAGRIDLIVTKSVSRFARNTVDSLTTVRKLKEKGVEVYFEKENIYTLDSKGELLITIMSSLAQEESRSISENTTWGQRKRIADGKLHLAYSNFLGYKKGKEDGDLEIVEEEAAIIRRIYQEFLAGKTPFDIAKRLTEDGIETPGHCKTWHVSTINSILNNEKYKGDARLQKSMVVDFLTHRSQPNHGEIPMIYVHQNHPPIIPPEMWEMVQEEFKRRSAAGGHVYCNSIFSGRIVCGDCGSFYGRKKWHSSTGYESWHWHCNNKFTKKAKCETPTLKEESLEETFVAAFNSVLARKKRIKANYARCLDRITDDTKLMARLAAVDQEAAELTALINSTVLGGGKMRDGADEVNRRYAQYVERHEKLREEKEALSSRISLLHAKRAQVEGYLRELDKLDGPLSKFDPLVFQATVNYLKVNRDCSVTFVMRDGSEIPWTIQNGVRKYVRRNKPVGNDPADTETEK